LASFFDYSQLLAKPDQIRLVDAQLVYKQQFQEVAKSVITAAKWPFFSKICGSWSATLTQDLT
jgi:hypothetical protein